MKTTALYRRMILSAVIVALGLLAGCYSTEAPSPDGTALPSPIPSEKEATVLFELDSLSISKVQSVINGSSRFGLRFSYEYSVSASGISEKDAQVLVKLQYPEEYFKVIGVSGQSFQVDLPKTSAANSGSVELEVFPDSISEDMMNSLVDNVYTFELSVYYDDELIGSESVSNS